MADLENLGEYLAKAKDAEEQAYRCKDPTIRESWQRIAISYREMAQRRLDTRTSGTTAERPSPLPAAKPTGP